MIVEKDLNFIGLLFSAILPSAWILKVKLKFSSYWSTIFIFHCPMSSGCRDSVLTVTKYLGIDWLVDYLFISFFFFERLINWLFDEFQNLSLFLYLYYVRILYYFGRIICKQKKKTKFFFFKRKYDFTSVYSTYFFVQNDVP